MFVTYLASLVPAVVDTGPACLVMLALTPGMAVTDEIKTGRHRVIEYVLSPLLPYRDES